MKRLLGLLLVVGMVGCGEGKTRHSWQRLPGKTVDLSKMTKRGGLMYEVNSETPFTGVRADKFGSQRREITYKDGKKEGLTTIWHMFGRKASEVTYKDGKAVSETKWDKEGNEIK